jgi:hypothetical protein
VFKGFGWKASVTAAVSALLLSACAGGSSSPVTPAFAPQARSLAGQPDRFEGAGATAAIKTLVWGKAPVGAAGTAIAGAKLTLTAKGSNGKAITGTYPTPITLANSDKSGATTLLINGKAASKKNTVKKSTDKIALKYSGRAIAAVTFTASAKGVKKPAKATFTPTVAGIVYTGPLVSSAPEIDLTSSTPATTGYSGSFTATQAGFTAPYPGAFAQSLSAVTGFTNNCATAYTIAPASGAAGSSFTISGAAGAAAGECLLTLTGALGQTKAVLLTFTTTSVGVNGRHAPH